MSPTISLFLTLLEIELSSIGPLGKLLIPPVLKESGRYFVDEKSDLGSGSHVLSFEHFNIDSTGQFDLGNDQTIVIQSQ